MLPLNEWYNFIHKNENYYLWLAFENEQPVGVVMVEIEDDFIGSIALVLNRLSAIKDMVGQ
ncbi:hypothetical protein [Metabacillus niabensis]|uniref:DUF2283 domain-containing protein n=2 Tax=Metabacillus niabensis TaxID=324854 RepID=A0ABT9Z8X8_9BACI|nr:hypothetical protein [Metabacillus niabensis]MDQ0228721.1 hypothetical protein [Metabacillus niabensis]